MKISTMQKEMKKGHGEEVGVSQTYGYDLERETLKGTLSLENLRKIEAVLGVNFEVEFEAD
ncbi:MAG TPA: helix-turn-helix transcriptional regulator [Leptolyngbyaceae cyanobacterium M33_DOE_097]|uniref:XRE family transcriptional regulator n=1 Tax=Oscillatoriales cyanobacterium SpSt-418 TaxID=2282169 RepID=A0A7C3PIP2_9CYAN|nr:helix-turn-helix transcriptional regulator [Leptolyngbyaceae cyanobacterium M33_DOE_097]